MRFPDIVEADYFAKSIQLFRDNMRSDLRHGLRPRLHAVIKLKGPIIFLKMFDILQSVSRANADIFCMLIDRI